MNTKASRKMVCGLCFKSFKLDEGCTLPCCNSCYDEIPEEERFNPEFENIVWVEVPSDYKPYKKDTNNV